MLEPIFSPLNYYLNQAKGTHANHARAYLGLLCDEAKVDRHANQETVTLLHGKEQTIHTLHKDSSGKKALRVLVIIGVILAYLLLAFLCLREESSLGEAEKWLLLLIGLGLAIYGIVFSCKKLNAKIRDLTSQIQALQTEANTLRNHAWQQVAPLNRLFKNDDSLNLFTKTLPFITFDRCFTAPRLNELVNTYGFQNQIDIDDCILDTLSGELYGNPFVYIQKLNHYLGTKTYQGHLTISWTTTERDSQGRVVTRTHTQTLYASIIRPAPYYHTDTTLYFGNDAIPKLDFSRTYAHVEDKSEAAIARTVRKGEKKIKKLEEKALKIGDDFQGVTNTEFDVLFGATDRTDDLEFLQMFTPRAQESMLELLLYKEGYGDDFSFVKKDNICMIRSEHAQGKPLYPTADAYQSYDLSAVENAFLSKNEEFFQSMYFDFAPLLLIPPYQQPLIRSQPIQDGDLTAYNYEAMAYKLSAVLQPDGAGTDSIFKTSLQERADGVDTVQVYAYSYRTVERVHYESVYGQDGRWHSVPVYWTEYIPIQKNSVIHITKDKTNVPNGGVTYRDYYAYMA